MIHTYTHKNLTWIDIENPTKEDIEKIAKIHNIDHLVAKELLVPTLRPKVEPAKNFIYLILHFPVFSGIHGQESDDQEIDFLIWKNVLITTHYERIAPLDEFSKLFEMNSILDKSYIGEHSGFLFFYIVRELYGRLEEELDDITKALNTVEEDVFSGKEQKMVFEISKINRDLLNFKQATRLHKEVLISLEVAGKKMFGEDFAPYLRALLGEYYKIENILESNRDTLLELRATNNSLLNTKTNEVMKVLTIMAFVTFPLMLVSSIFGMNTVVLPLVGLKHDFWIIISIMILATISFFWFFKKKGWL